MPGPFLRVAASGDGGSGYSIPTWPDADGKPTKTVGVTTVLNAINKPALLQWVADNVSSYAVLHIDDLLNRTEEAGYGFLRHMWNSPASWEPLDDDNLRHAHRRVLNDAGELGTRMHNYIEADLNGWPLPPVITREHQQMVEAWDQFKSEHWIEPILTEFTAVNRGAGYAGTADLLAKIDGVSYILDNKTSRNTWDEHKAQIAALGACDEYVQECGPDDEGAVEYQRSIKPDSERTPKNSDQWFESDWLDYWAVVTTRGIDWSPNVVDGKVTTYWRSAPIPAFSEYGLIHIRPADTDNKGNYIAPFCKLITLDHSDINPAFELFEGALTIKRAQRRLKSNAKLKEKGDN